MMKQLHGSSRRTQFLSRLVAVAAMLALVFAVQISSAPTAHANANGCTLLSGLPGDQVCIDVIGNGLFVKTAEASFFALTIAPCKTKLYITFFDTSNRAYDQRISPLESGCVFASSYTQSYNTTMREGRVCGAISIDGDLKPGACVRIKK
jgi:hypothetical protein